MVEIRNAFLTAEVAELGAELVRLRDGAGADWLWEGDPAFWKGRAPLLFPIVGKVPNDQIRVDGVDYPMKQHGLARTAVFEPTMAEPSRCRFRLVSSPATLAQFPFAFELEVEYALEARTIAIAATVANRSDRAMPVSFGFHPALRWPFPEGGAREDYFLEFEAPEPAPIRRLRAGLLTPERIPSPVEGRTLYLSDALFADDALVFDRLASRRLKFVAPSGRAIGYEFPDMPHLGIWTKPGAGFLCVEPWQGYAAAEGFAGELAQKPGLVALDAGASRTFAMRITLPE